MNEIIRQRKGTKMELELHEAFDIVVDESASQVLANGLDPRKALANVLYEIIWGEVQDRDLTEVAKLIFKMETSQIDTLCVLISDRAKFL